MFHVKPDLTVGTEIPEEYIVFSSIQEEVVIRSDLYLCKTLLVCKKERFSRLKE